MSSSSKTKTFFGHPFQLSSLFHIELWERFSFYGMQAILLYYLYFEATKGGLGIDKTEAGGIAAIYSGSIYLLTLLGGWLSDRVLGAERTLFYSGIVVMAGHIALAILPGMTGLAVGLILVALGSGGVKSSASAMVGALYDQDDTRHLRDAGFSLFYLAINIGGFFGPLIAGYLQDKIGFHWGFGAAAVGMAFGLWQYARGRKNLPKTAALNPLNSREKGIAIGVALAGLAMVAILFATEIIHYGNFKNVLFGVVLFTALVYFIRLIVAGKQLGAKPEYIFAYIPLFIATCIFWAVWFQVYTAVSIYFESFVNRNVAGFEVPPAWLAAAQSFWVIALASAMAALWTKLGEKQPKTPMKYTLSLVITGLAYALFLPYTSDGTIMSIWGIVLVLFMLTVGELLISPISLSLATKIAPTQFKTQMVALNFLTISVGITLGGKVFGAFYDEKDLSVFFQMMTGMGVGAGCLLLLLVPLLNKLLKGID